MLIYTENDRENLHQQSKNHKKTIKSSSINKQDYKERFMCKKTNVAKVSSPVQSTMKNLSTDNI